MSDPEAIPCQKKTGHLVLIRDGMILTVANLIAAFGNYLFQAMMGRHLSLAEFGYLNSSFGLISFAGVPLTAASQAVAHHLARLSAEGKEEALADVQAKSLKFLRHLTWMIFAASVVLLHPVATFFRFPRMSLAWMALAWVPVNLWAVLGQGWCAGFSRFRLLSGLLISSAVARLVAGYLIVQFFPKAEAGVAANIIAALVLAAVAVFNPHHGTSSKLRESVFDSDTVQYGLASLAVCLGLFAFLQGDQVIAQRHFPGELLGRYTAAGLLGRAIVWGALPVLTVYFTNRSEQEHGTKASGNLLWSYLALLGCGSLFLIIFSKPLLYIFLKRSDPDMVHLMGNFAVVMIPIGILQAMGNYYLAARRKWECFLFGLGGVFHLGLLTWAGRTPALMITLMFGSSLGVILFMAAAALVLWSRSRP